MTDLITAVSIIFGATYPIDLRTVSICALQIGTIVSSTLASVYSIGLIAIDRYLYIIHGLKYQQWIYPNRARTLILITWILGFVIGFLPLFGWSGDTDNGRVCWFIKLAPKYLILLTVIIGIVPLIIVLILYGKILYHAIDKILQIQRSLRQQRGEQQASNVTTTNRNDQVGEDKPNELRMFRGKSYKNEPSKWKAIKVVLFTSGSFLITWGPYFVVSLIYSYCVDDVDESSSRRCKNLSFLIASPLAILGFCNSLINPIIYAWWHKGFRDFVSKRWSSIRMKNKDRWGMRKASSSNGKDTASTGASSKTNVNSSRKSSNTASLSSSTTTGNNLQDVVVMENK